MKKSFLLLMIATAMMALWSGLVIQSRADTGPSLRDVMHRTFQALVGEDSVD